MLLVTEWQACEPTVEIEKDVDGYYTILWPLNISIGVKATYIAPELMLLQFWNLNVITSAKYVVNGYLPNSMLLLRILLFLGHN